MRLRRCPDCGAPVVLEPDGTLRDDRTGRRHEEHACPATRGTAA